MNENVILTKNEEVVHSSDIPFSYIVTFNDEYIGEIYIHESKQRSLCNCREVIKYPDIYNFHIEMSNELYTRNNLDYVENNIFILILFKYNEVLKLLINKVLENKDNSMMRGVIVDGNDLYDGKFPEAYVDIIVYRNSDNLLNIALHQKKIPYETMLKDEKGDICCFSKYFEALSYIRKHHKLKEFDPMIKLHYSDFFLETE